MDKSIIWTVAWMAVILISVIIRAHNRSKSDRNMPPAPPFAAPDADTDTEAMPPLPFPTRNAIPQQPYMEPEQHMPQSQQQTQTNSLPPLPDIPSAARQKHHQKKAGNTAKPHTPQNGSDQDTADDIHKIVEEFDLKKAVIYSEIMKPKFDQ